MDTTSQLHFPYCPDHQLDPLGHHAMTCKGGGDVVLCHNSLRVVCGHHEVTYKVGAHIT